MQFYNTISGVQAFLLNTVFYLLILNFNITVNFISFRGGKFIEIIFNVCMYILQNLWYEFSDFLYCTLMEEV